MSRMNSSMITLQKIIKRVNGNQITFKWVPDKRKIV